MNSSDLKYVDELFTTNGKDVWKLKWSCMTPSCEMVNVETGEIQSFGMGGITAEGFHRIIMPEQVLKKEDK